jgi:DNA-binding transcriptional MerR regulator
MGYTIKQVAEKIDLTPYTLRYYEKEGLLPFVRRNERGNRIFDDKDLEWITLICCLRDTGMSVADIKRYVELCQDGNKTIGIRRQIMLDHKQSIEQKMKKLQHHLDKINKKLEYYDNFQNTPGIDRCNPNSHKKKVGNC